LPAAGMEKDKKNARDTSLFESLKKAKLPWPVAPLYGITFMCKKSAKPSHHFAIIKIILLYPHGITV
jgi:hypothetical protein